MRPSAAVAAVLVPFALWLPATPAQAYPNCIMDGGPGLRVSVYVGTKLTEAEQARFDIIRLRGIGVIAASAERTPLGCLKVTRRDASGRWITEYYNAETLEPKRLDLRLP